MESGSRTDERTAVGEDDGRSTGCGRWRSGSMFEYDWQLPVYDLCVLGAQRRPSHWGGHDHGYLLAVLRVRFPVQLKQIFLLKHNPHKDVTGRSN